jgi:hypothetical protein
MKIIPYKANMVDIINQKIKASIFIPSLRLGLDGDIYKQSRNKNAINSYYRSHPVI